MAGLSVILAFAASGSGGVDPVSLSAKGYIECAQPDESSKTCEGMATPAEARRLHARLHDDPEEAELGASQGRQGPPDQPASK
jgi:hypothetical protein